MTSQTTASKFDIGRIRSEFPILARQLNDKPIVYMDNAATSQKPIQVLNAIDTYYRMHNANVHRGVHILSEEATDAYEAAREKARSHINATDRNSIVFVRGTTEALNLVAQAYGRPRLNTGDEILITHMEHHSNIVPWQLVAQQTGATLKVTPILEDGSVDMRAFGELLNARTKICSFVHVSNALGTVNPVASMVAMAKQAGATTIVDGAQAAPHLKIDVGQLGCDFYTISGHKMFAPTGIGVLFGRPELLESMDPYQGGGEMIKYVSFDETIYNDIPHKFEAGTPNIAGAVGLGAAIDYMNGLDWRLVHAHEAALLRACEQSVGQIEGVRLIGTAPQKAGVVSFEIEDIHPHDIGTILSHEGICVRTGHHCAQPVMAFFDVPATVRASLAFYNTFEEVERLQRGLQRVREVLGR